MKDEDFEKKLARTPMREIPPAWRAEILQYAAQPLPPEAPVPAAVSAANVTPPAPVPPPHKGSWRDLLWPSPKAWAALACIWLAIFISNIRIHSAQTPKIAATGAEPLVMRLAQERAFAENQGAGL
jgi:hypothetical protein